MANTETMQCSWNNCTAQATQSLGMDYGQETCETCGAVRNNTMTFNLCEEHWSTWDQNNRASSTLIINATGAMSNGTD